VTELGLVGVTIPGLVGGEPLDLPKFRPFFEAVDALDTTLGLHAVTGMHDTPWADCFRDFFSTHVTAMPFSVMVALTSLMRGGLFETLPNLRVAFLEVGASWLPYWAWWVGHHVDEWAERGFRARPDFDDWGGPSQDIAPTRRPLDYVREGRILTGFELEEDLRYIVDKLGAAGLMYASDYPHGDMSWSKVADTRAHPALTPTEVDALLGGNAARFYKLPVAARA
jgi:uncharacterized protein